MARISGGQYDTTDTNVVGIAIMIPNGQGFAMCSGSLIAPNLVLTARHCVAQVSSENVICGTSNFGSTYPASSFFVTTKAQIPYSAQGYTGVQEVRVPSEGSDMCGYDVALLVLSSPIAASTAKPLVPRIDKEVVVGETYTAIGYGQTSDTNQASSGTRMERTSLRVSWYNGDSLPAVCGSTVCGYGMASGEWQGETGICSGDSGGPALDTRNMIIGVVSRGSQGCQTPIYSEVAAWKTFIMQGAVDAAQKGGYQPPAWAISGNTGANDPVGAGGAAGATGTGGAAGAGAGGSGAGGAAGTGPATDAQGTSCDSSHACPSGYACVYDSDPNKAYCAADCTAATDCGSGLVCDGTTHACMNAPAASSGAGNSGSAGGCTVVRGRGPAKPVPWLVGLGLALAATVRRRRRG